MAEIIRHRTGNICRKFVNGRPYWVATIKVDKIRTKKSSKHRAVVEAWLADMVAAHPTYVFRTNKAKALETWAARGRRWARWAVVAKTDPLTAAYHLHTRHDWQIPRKIITYDYINDAPTAWLADDNGGKGFTRLRAQAAAARMPRDCGILYTARPLAGIKLIKQWDR